MQRGVEQREARTAKVNIIHQPPSAYVSAKTNLFVPIDNVDHSEILHSSSLLSKEEKLSKMTEGIITIVYDIFNDVFLMAHMNSGIFDVFASLRQ